MKNRRFRAIVLAFALSGMFATIGAKGLGILPDPQTIAKKQTEWMKKDLSLTADQTTKVEDINLKFAKKMENLHQDKDKDLKEVLTQEQFEKYKAKQEQHWNAKKQEMNKTK